MGLFSRSKKPKIKIEDKKSDSYSGWVKCSGCSEMIHANELKDNINCCPKCDYHYRLTLDQRLEILADKKTFKEMFQNIKPIDPLDFVDSKTYKERLKLAEEKSNRDEAVIVGTCEIYKQKTALAILDGDPNGFFIMIEGGRIDHKAAGRIEI